MAADILLYDSTHVPVGEDQKQHLELSRDIAQKFNLDYEVPNFFKIPEPLIQKNFSRIMSLKDGTKKMSKTDPSDLSRINMTDSKEQIINKIKKAKTDTDLLPNSDKDINKRPEAENLLGIYSSMNHQSLAKTINEFSGKNFSDLKQKLAEIVAEKILSFRVNSFDPLGPDKINFPFSSFTFVSLGMIIGFFPSLDIDI